MAELNIDKLRAEQGLEEHEVTIDGKVYTLPPVLPLAFIMKLMNASVDPSAVIDALAILFGDDAEAVSEYIGDDELTKIATELYGVELGESPASPKPSKRTGPKSRPTSKPSTD